MTQSLTLFDLDCTLLPIDSDHAFGDFLVRQGWADASVFKARNDAFYADYTAQRLDMNAYVQFATSAWRNRPLHEALVMRERFMAEVIEPVLHPSAINLVDRHRRQGDWVALVTATNEFVTRPIADALGIGCLIATELARDAQGAVTGAIRGMPCYREGKIDRVSAWLATRGARFEDFETITVYSDSMNDLPLLERATHPVATNPSPSLAATALARGWRTLHLFT